MSALSEDALSAEVPDGRARRALEAARDHLLGLQHPDGWWKGVLDTNVTMDAEDLLLRVILGVLSEDVSIPAAAWIRSQQRADGSWATFYGGPGDLSTTVEAYVALRVAGEGAGEPHMEAAARFVRERGGLARTRVFTRVWLAMVGLWPWDELPALPPEMVLLPSFIPLNIYDFACWARQTVVALTVVAAHRPVHRLAFGVPELGVPELGEERGLVAGGMVDATPEGGASRARPSPTTRALLVLDRLLRRYERHPIRPLRRLAMARAERWIVERQEADGSWGGIQPPWVYSLLALRLLGYELDHPVMAAGLAGIDRFVVHEGGTRRLEACQSPVWDTALAVTALRDAGVRADDPPLQRAVAWLLGEEIRVKGDWSVRRPALAPGGWAFEFANLHYPDIDDTAIVVLALVSCGLPATAGAVDRGVRWVLGMRSSDGGWGAFDVDNAREACRELPFCDFGEVIDPPSADVTAHVVEMLAACGQAGEPATRGGMDWLFAAQEPDGAWFGRWGVNYVYGTGAAVPALVAAGAAPSDPRLTRAGQWLVAHQNPDGGWGEDLRSYTDPSWRGKGTSTASQTAWALLALLALDGGHDAPFRTSVERGIAFLADSQGEDGTWDEPWYTGTGFPGDFSINYHLYRLVFPVMALGRYVRLRGEDGKPATGMVSQTEVPSRVEEMA